MEKGDECVESLFLNYVQDIFMSSMPTDVEDICEVVKGKLSKQHKSFFPSVFKVEVDSDAIFQMHPLKALGPMVYLPYFSRSIGT